ncbi:MAG TPA: hypothetical protein VK196_16225 [Magnetospirillum sp.]|nr:hypothetical protein [Magnetospirillum sp.]
MVARLIVVLCTLMISACSIKANEYSFSPENVQALREAGSSKVRLGAVTSQMKDESAGIHLRAASMVSPYGSYAAYLKEALRQELEEAGRLTIDSDAEISGTLTKNEFDASGISVGEGALAAVFTVRRGGKPVYERIHEAKITWESAFSGAVAIPRAVGEYRKLMQKLVQQLLHDPAFLEAIR